MNLRELKELINSIPSEYDSFTLYSGNPSLGAKEVTVKTDLMFYNEKKFIELHADVEEEEKFGKFTDIAAIAHFIREGKKIAAIKEVRYQTNWGLREAKDFIVHYMPMEFDTDSSDDCERAALKLINDHKPIDFLDASEMEI